MQRSESAPPSPEFIRLPSGRGPQSSGRGPQWSEPAPQSSELAPQSWELVPRSSELVPQWSELVPQWSGWGTATVREGGAINGNRSAGGGSVVQWVAARQKCRAVGFQRWRVPRMDAQLRLSGRMESGFSPTRPRSIKRISRSSLSKRRCQCRVQHLVFAPLYGACGLV